MATSMHTIQPTAIGDGILVARKETGWTSHDVVAKLRNLLGGVKVGHAGTLDPAATGVLPLLVGRATRLAEYLVEWDKEYVAVLRLGETTDTQDATGASLTRVEIREVNDHALREVVARFLGAQWQLPPMYSAVKIAGRPLYKAARAGQTVERRERAITVHELDVLAVEGCDVTLRVLCTKGTYVRTLCADIGEALGVGGHLLTLERRRVGPLSVDHALTVGQIVDQLAMGTLHKYIMSLDQALESMPVVVVTDEQARRLLHGGAVSPMSALRLPSIGASSATVRLHDSLGRLLGLGTYDGRSDGRITIHKVLAGIDLYN